MHMVGKMLSCCETLFFLIYESIPPLDASTELALLANVST